MTGIDQLVKEANATAGGGSSGGRRGSGRLGIDSLVEEANKGVTPPSWKPGREPDEINPPIAPTSFTKEFVKGIPGAIKDTVVKAVSPPSILDLVDPNTTDVKARIQKGFASGLISTFSSLAKAVPLIEKTVGIEPGPVGKGAEKAAEKMDVAIAKLSPADPKFLDALASGAGSMASFMIPGGFTAKGLAKVAPLFPRLAAWAGTGVATVTESYAEAGGLYSDLKKKGYEDKDAEQIANKALLFNMALLAVTNKLGVFGETGNRLKRTLMTMVTEGAQEGGQSIIEQGGHGTAAKDLDWKEIRLNSAVGAIIGGGAGAVSHGTIPGTAPQATRPRTGAPAPQTAAPSAAPGATGASVRGIDQLVAEATGTTTAPAAELGAAAPVAQPQESPVPSEASVPLGPADEKGRTLDRALEMLRQEEMGGEVAPAQSQAQPRAEPEVQPQQELSGIDRLVQEANAAPAVEAKETLAMEPAEKPKLETIAHDAVKEKPGELKALPVDSAPKDQGPARAAFAYFDPYRPGEGVVPIFNVFGAKTDPIIQKAGFGSSLRLQDIKALGVPITGREDRTSGQDYAAALKQYQEMEIAESARRRGKAEAAGQTIDSMNVPLGGGTKAEISDTQRRANEIFGERAQDDVSEPETLAMDTSAAPAAREPQTEPEAASGPETVSAEPMVYRGANERQPVVGDQAQQGEIVRRRNIVKDMEKRLGVPIRTGRLGSISKRVLGYFKIKPEVVRLRSANDIETAAHETGHFLEKTIFGGTGVKGGVSVFKRFESELLPIATKSHGGVANQLTEGFAEFIRYYTTNPEYARKVAPTFSDYFERELMTEHPQLLDVFRAARENYDRWLKQPSAARIMSQISLEADKEAAFTFDDFYSAVIDDLNYVKVFRDKMAKGKLDPNEDPYTLARLSRGWIGKADVFLNHETFDYKTLKATGKSLKEILKPFEQRMNDLRVYLVSKRAVELHKRGIKTGITDADARFELDRLDKNAEFAKAATELEAYQDSLLRYLVDSGVMKTEVYLRIKAVSDAYVPFYRLIDDRSNVGKTAGTKFGDLFDPVKRIHGSSEEIVDPLESIMKNTYAFIQVAEHNAVGQALVKLAGKTEGSGKYIEKLPPQLKPVQVPMEEVVKALNARHLAELFMQKAAGQPGTAGDKLMDPDQFAGELFTTFRANQLPERGGNVISVLEGGKRNYYQLHPKLYEAMMALDKESTPLLVKLMSVPATTLRIGATLSPEFGIRNPIKDQWSAFIYSRYGYRPGFDLARGLFHVLKADSLYVQWLKSGGARAGLFSQDRSEHQKKLREIVKKETAAGTLKNLILHPLDAMRVIMELGEEATRLGEFARATDKLGTQKSASLEAGLASREVTLDFWRVGSRLRAARSLTAFLGASVQGIDKLAREFKERPREVIVKSMVGITLPSMLLWALNHDEEWYKEKKQWEKDMFWFITKDIRIPKPFDLGILFGSIPERVLEHIQGDNPDLTKSILGALDRGFMINVIPTFASPLIENFANWSLFFDRPIVGRGEQDLLPEFQVRPMTSHVAIALGKLINYSPAKVENLIRGYFGGLGKLGLDAVDKAGEWAGLFEAGPDLERTLADIPGIKGLISRYPAMDTRSLEEFYETLNKSKSVTRTFQHLAKQDPEAAREFRKKHGDVLMAAPILEAMDSVIGENRKTIKALITGKRIAGRHFTLDPKARTDMLNKTILDTVRLADKANEMVREKLEAAARERKNEASIPSKSPAR